MISFPLIPFTLGVLSLFVDVALSVWLVRLWRRRRFAKARARRGKIVGGVAVRGRRQQE